MSGVCRPSGRRLIFLLDGGNFTGHLLLDTGSGNTEIRFARGGCRGPRAPPVFYVLLHGCLLGDHLVRVGRPSLRHIIVFMFSDVGRVNSVMALGLVYRLLDNDAGVVLASDDCGVVSTLHEDSVRGSAHLVLSNTACTLPPGTSGLGPLAASLDGVGSRLGRGTLLRAVSNFSPLVYHRVRGKTDLGNIVGTVGSGNSPALILGPSNAPLSCSCARVLRCNDNCGGVGFRDCNRLLSGFCARGRASLEIGRCTGSVVELMAGLGTHAREGLSSHLISLRGYGSHRSLQVCNRLVGTGLRLVGGNTSFTRIPGCCSTRVGDVHVPLGPTLSPADGTGGCFGSCGGDCATRRALAELATVSHSRVVCFSSILRDVSEYGSLSSVSRVHSRLVGTKFVGHARLQGGRAGGPRFGRFASGRNCGVLINGGGARGSCLAAILTSGGSV